MPAHRSRVSCTTSSASAAVGGDGSLEVDHAERHETHPSFYCALLRCLANGRPDYPPTPTFTAWLCTEEVPQVEVMLI